ncbi:MAG: extracellular solute-binding protein [Firmicutes bacterium]|nr:extracellular solute-binding protein [Bacillota bacterium]
MKKVLVKVLVVIFSVGMIAGFFAGCAAREHTLKIYNWNDYMDESVIGEFRDYYREVTGKRLRVVTDYFEHNEDIPTRLNLGDDYDLICPSDYMIERLLRDDMLQKLEEETLDLYDEVSDPRIKDIITKYVDPDNKYTVPYMWGTIGIMYDATRITDPELLEGLNSWAALWDDRHAANIYMKRQERDAYAVAMLHHYRDELKEKSNDFTDYDNEEYRTLLTKIFQEVSAESIDQAKVQLTAQRPLVRGYRADESDKEEMIAGGHGTLGLFWSCDAGYAMGDLEEEPGFFSCSKTPRIVPGNKNLGYVVPKEGTNVWVDGWVVPKTAKNSKVANMFIRFTLDKEIAKLNSLYAGAPSANMEATNELRAEYEEDDEFFKGGHAQFREMFMEAMFPSDETLARAAVMRDFGAEFYNDVALMFQAVINSRA